MRHRMNCTHAYSWGACFSILTYIDTESISSCAINWVYLHEVHVWLCRRSLLVAYVVGGGIGEKVGQGKSLEWEIKRNDERKRMAA